MTDRPPNSLMLGGDGWATIERHRLQREQEQASAVDHDDGDGGSVARGILFGLLVVSKTARRIFGAATLMIFLVACLTIGAAQFPISKGLAAFIFFDVMLSLLMALFWLAAVITAAFARRAIKDVRNG